MSCYISSIHYFPVKSLSFSNLNKCFIKKNLGILNDRYFALSRNINFEKAKLIEQSPNERKLNYFLTLKNTPALNKYRFTFREKILTLFKGNNKITSASSDNTNQLDLIVEKILELEESLTKPIFLLKNENYPFFDTTHSNKIANTISLININSIKDLEKKINVTIEFERFRSNLYVDGIDAWTEKNWIGKIIKINQISYLVQNHIPRCSATNLKPGTDNITINLPMTLMKHFNHIDMGVYICPLNDGEINIGDQVTLNE